MRKGSTVLFFIGFICIAYLSLAGCNQLAMPELSMPQMGFGEKPHSPIQASVAFAFDPSVTQSKLEIQACGLPYTLNTGEMIPQAFLAVGKERFSSVTAFAGSGQAVHASQKSDLTIYLRLLNQSFRPVDRIAQEDNYLATVTMQMQAVYLDREGKEIAQTPLNYQENVSVWTPELSSQSVSCATGQIDNQFAAAATQLAQQLASLTPELLGKEQPQIAQANVQAPPVNSGPLPTLKFRTLLQDGNNNLILEAGEVLSLQMETTNNGTNPLTGVQVNLSGNPTLTQAFTQVTPFPISLGSFGPGEAKTTEIRGRMPSNVQDQNGELVISFTTGDGKTIGSHRILAVLKPNGTIKNGTPAKTSGTETGPPASVKPVTVTGPPYFAILAGLNTYRDPWPGTKLPFVGELQPLTDVLEITGVFGGDHLKKLQGSQATKAALEEAIFTWAGQRITQETVLLFYFYGEALVHATSGEVYLLPYDSSPSGSSKSLIPLQALQTALAKLNAKATLLFLDTPLIQVRKDDSLRPVNWEGALPKLAKAGNNSLIQIRNRNPTREGDSARMLAGLFGRADHNSDHTITIGELLEDVKGTAEITPSAPLLPSQAGISLTQ